MTNYLNHSFDRDAFDLVSVTDELPLWSAPFGMRLLDAIQFRPNLKVLDAEVLQAWNHPIEIKEESLLRIGQSKCSVSVPEDIGHTNVFANQIPATHSAVKRSRGWKRRPDFSKSNRRDTFHKATTIGVVVSKSKWP